MGGVCKAALARLAATHFEVEVKICEVEGLEVLEQQRFPSFGDAIDQVLLVAGVHLQNCG